MTANGRNTRRRRQTGHQQPAFIVRCSICTQPIDDGAGYIECESRKAIEADIRQTQNQLDRMRREIEGGPSALCYTGSDLLDLDEDDVPWRAFHGSCDPDVDGGTYWIGVERIRTWQDVLDWTLHLNEKSWTQFTNWDNVLRKLIATGEIAP